MIAVDIAILPPEPVKSLSIELSKKISPEFHLNELDILPHITLGIGFVESVLSIKYKVLRIAAGFKPFEVVVDRVEGRYLTCERNEELYSLHKQICDAVEFVHLGKKELDQIRERTLPASLRGRSGPEQPQGSISNLPYVEPVNAQTKDYTNNFTWRNAYENYVPHITIGWNDKKDYGLRTTEYSPLPVKFTVEEIFVCQLGNNNTCRKVLAKQPFL